MPDAGCRILDAGSETQDWRAFAKQDWRAFVKQDWRAFVKQDWRAFVKRADHRLPITDRRTGALLQSVPITDYRSPIAGLARFCKACRLPITDYRSQDWRAFAKRASSYDLTDTDYRSPITTCK